MTNQLILLKTKGVEQHALSQSDTLTPHSIREEDPPTNTNQLSSVLDQPQSCSNFT